MKDIEERIYRDVNGFYNGQLRFLPPDPWEPCDGWRTFYTSSSPESVRERMRPGYRDCKIVTAPDYYTYHNLMKGK